MKQVSAQEIKGIIKKLYSLSEKGEYLALMIWGKMGIGKSQIVKQIAGELDIDFIDLRLSLLNPVDLMGLPVVDKVKQKANWLPPAFLPNGNNKEKGILFLDEINLAPQSVMNAGYQLILDRKLGNYKLPEGWLIIAAGNRAEDTFNTTKMPPPLANRFIHLTLEPDFDEWRQWAVKNGISEQVVTFLSKMPQHFFKAPTVAEKTFPSPRSWEFASKLHEIGESVDSAVGEGVGAEFRTFLRVYERIPNVDDILAGKEVRVPENAELDVLWATSMALVYRAEPKQWSNVYNYIVKFPVEFTTLIIKLLDDKSPKMHGTIVPSPEFAEFRKKHPSIFTE